MIPKDIEDKFLKLKASYLPEWHYTPFNGSSTGIGSRTDSGSALATLINDMHSQSMKCHAKLLNKHKIEYLSMFYPLFSEEAKTAKSYVQFTQAAGVDTPVHIPAKTKLLAEQGENRVLFETAYSITATSAQLKAVYATDREADRIVCLSDDGNDGFVVKANGTNLADHSLLLGFDSLFTSLSKWESKLFIKLRTAEEGGAQKQAELLSSGEAVFFAPASEQNQKEYIFPTPEVNGDTLILSLEGYTPEKTIIGSKEQYVIGIRPKKLLPVAISGLSVYMEASEISPKEVLSQGIMQEASRFLPFGSPMNLYSECGINCGSLLMRRGACVTMRFNLSYESFEQKLPVISDDEELRMIMKKSANQRYVEPLTVRADCVVIEYLSFSGWKQLVKDTAAYELFNGKKEGAIALSFICPEDVLPSELTDAPVLRLRLTRADNLFHIPSVQLCPVISGLSFDYRYDEDSYISADTAITDNHFVKEDITSRLSAPQGRSIELFYNTLHQKEAVYFGFDAPLSGMPLSMYFEVENPADMPVDFVWEYCTGEDFAPMQAVDNTGGLLYSGTMLMPISQRLSPAVLFGREQYWLRMLCLTELKSPPKIHSIRMNMVKVENQLTNEVSFFAQSAEKPLTFSLGYENISSAEVYVNEESGWVRWSERVFKTESGRVYDIDMASGAVTLLLSAVSLKPDEEAVLVRFQSYQGRVANVSQGQINSMYEPIKYISSVTNPMAAYGGFDGDNEETGAKLIANALRTRGRAVTSRDYFDIISQVTYGVRKIKCVSGIDRFGQPADEVITIALLLDEYEKGSHIFSSVKDTIRQKLLSTGSLIPLGKKLVLSQPHFIRMSARIWVKLAAGESMYDIQQETSAAISAFIDPLTGGFYKEGWEIGTVPRTKQLLAYLKSKLPGIHVTRLLMAAAVDGQELEVDDEIHKTLNNPFAMAINGEHHVYIEL